jgi:molybdate transport system substrate-binding protein
MRVAAGVRTLTILVILSAASFADAADLRVFSTGAPSVAAKVIGAKFSAETGDRLKFSIGQPAAIQRRLAAGEQADVVILPSRIIARLNASGAWRTGSAIDLARVGIGVVVRDGSNRPDISSAAAIRKLLLDAHTIVYPDPRTGGGSAGRAIAHMIDQLGIADAVKGRVTRKSAIGGGVDLVAKGAAEIGLFNISEILPVKGVTLIGPLPADMQNYIVFTAAIPAGNAAPEPATLFVKTLAEPAARQAWRSAGLEPVGVAP